LKLKKDQKFIWGDEQQKAFDEIKQYMREPPVLVPPQLNKPFKLYVAAKYSEFGKWSPNWEGPFRVVRCVPGNAYMLKTLQERNFLLQ
jgi:hypothetical protein